MLLSYSVSRESFIATLFHFYRVTFHIRMLFHNLARLLNKKNPALNFVLNDQSLHNN